MIPDSYLEFQNYPMDKQKCEFRLGSHSPNYKFYLHDPDGSYHKPYQDENADYVMDIRFFDEDRARNINKKGLGFKIEMDRKIKSYLLRYYLTSSAIVLASLVSFIIPIDVIPGRIGLIVTLFLTLTNIFIAQMVSKLGFLWFNTIKASLVLQLFNLEFMKKNIRIHNISICKGGQSIRS